MAVPPVELYKHLPFCAKNDLAKWIITYYNDLSMTKPESWNVLQYVGIPKEEGIPSFEGIRWIGKTAAGQQWFMRCVIQQLEAELVDSPVILIGFKKKAMIEDSTGILLEIMHHHYKWGGRRKVFIGSLDIETAFEQMEHAQIVRALEKRKVHPHHIALIIRELGNYKLTMEIPTAGETKECIFTKTGVQGGTGTPTQFRLMVEAAMQETVISWNERKAGVTMDAITINHYWWADNLYLVAKTATEFRCMVAEATKALHDYGLCWKAKSAELLTTPNVSEAEKDIKMDMPQKDGTVQEVTFKPVDCMRILGSMVDSMGTPQSLLQNRFAAAQRAYWTKIRLWRAGH